MHVAARGAAAGIERQLAFDSTSGLEWLLKPCARFFLFSIFFLTMQVRCFCAAASRRACSACVSMPCVSAAAVELALTVGLHVLALLDLPQLQEAAGARKKSENQEWPSDEVSESP